MTRHSLSQEEGEDKDITENRRDQKKHVAKQKNSQDGNLKLQENGVTDLNTAIKQDFKSQLAKQDSFKKRKINTATELIEQLKKGTQSEKFKIYSGMARVSKRHLGSIVSKFPTAIISLVAVPLGLFGVYHLWEYPDEMAGMTIYNKFPGVNRHIIRPTNLSLTTCKTINYLNKIDWRAHKKLYYYPGSTFIICGPEMRLSKTRFYGGVFRSTFQNRVSNFFLMSKSSHIFFPERILHYNYKALQTASTPVLKSKVFSQSQLSNLQYWQSFFIHLDILPAKTNNVFNFSNRRKICRPLFDNLHQDKKITIKRKRSFAFLKMLLNFRAKKYISLKPSYFISLNRSVNQLNLFDNPKFEGKQRFLQYKMANNWAVVRDLLAFPLFRDTLYELDERPIDIIEYIYSKNLSGLTKPFEKFTARSVRKGIDSAFLNRQFGLLDAIDSSVRTFEIRTHDRYKYFFKQYYSLEHIFSNMFYMADVRKNPTSRLHNYRRYQSSNPMNVHYSNKARTHHLYFGDPETHLILSDFQTLLEAEMGDNLKTFNLKRPYFKIKLACRGDAGLLETNLTSPFSKKVLTKRPYLKLKSTSVDKMRSIKRNIIKSESAVLKRQFSGYLFPDTRSPELILKHSNWVNSFFQNPKHDDIYIRIFGPVRDSGLLFTQISQGHWNSFLTNRNENLDFNKKVDSKVLLMQDTSKFWGKGAPDSQDIFVDRETYKPSHLKYKSKRWLNSTTDEDIETRAYEELDPDFEDDCERELYNHNIKLLKKEPELSYEYELKCRRSHRHNWGQLQFFFHDNQRCLPLPRTDKSEYIKDLEWKLQNVTPGFHTSQPIIKLRPAGNHFRYTSRLDSTQNSDRLQFSNGNIIKEPFALNHILETPKFFRLTPTIYNLADPVVIYFLIVFYHFMQGLKCLIHNYSDALWESLEEFLYYLDIPNLVSFKSLDRFVVPPSDFRLADIQGGYNLFKRFLPTLIFLRSKRKRFTEVEFMDGKFFYNPPLSWRFLLSEQVYNEALNKWSKGLQNNSNLTTAKTLVPKGYLLVGAPGTGKTFLVKALSGEAQCSVITNSFEDKSNSNYSSGQMDQYQRTAVLHKLFKAASFRGPCILFIDELDTLGPKRKRVLGGREQTALGPKLFYTPNSFVENNAFSLWQTTNVFDASFDLSRNSLLYWSVVNPKIVTAEFTPRTKFPRFKPPITFLRPPVEAYIDLQNHDISGSELETVMVLLCELDGLVARDNIVVIGATNRPNALDPALIRPGRLGEVIYLDLPNKQKRLQLLKFYAKNYFSDRVDWDFFASHGQTGGLSSAHLKVAMNTSTLTLINKAFNRSPISDEPHFKNQNIELHNNLTIEYGIQSVRFQNVYVTQASYKLAKKYNQHFLNQTTYSLCTNPNTHFYVTQNIETVTCSKPLYIVNQVDGIQVSLPTFPKPFNGSYMGANLSAPYKIHSKTKLIYKRFYKKLRLLYLLSDKKTLFLNKLPYDYQPKEQIFGLDRFEKIVQRTQEDTQQKIFKNYQNYVNRVIKVHVFGLKLLINSSYFLENPLIFSFRHISANIDGQRLTSHFKWASFQQQNRVHLTLINKSNKHSLLISIDSPKVQQSFFGDNLALKRAAYYTAGKALVISLLEESIFDSVTLSFWSNIKQFHEQSLTQKAFLKQVVKQLVTKSQFEKYLFMLIAGKVGEHFLLANKQDKNYSDLGITELQKMGWLANIMVDKGLLYTTPASAALKVTAVQTLPTPVTQDIAPLLNQRTFFMGLPKSTVVESQNDWGAIPYWWASKLQYDMNDIGFNNTLWTYFWNYDYFALRADIITYVPPTMVSDTRHNTLNIPNEIVRKGFTGSLDLSRKAKAQKESDINSESDVNSELGIKSELKRTSQSAELNTDLRGSSITNDFNREILTTILEAPDFNWNHLSMTVSQNLFSQLIFDCFGQAFNLLDNNRQLLDYFIYRFGVENQLTGVEIKQIANGFLIPIGDLGLMDQRDPSLSFREESIVDDDQLKGIDALT